MPKEASAIISVEDISLDVYYTFYPASPGVREISSLFPSGGVMISPPEDAYIEITGIYLDDCTPKIDLIDLVDIDKVEEALSLYISSQSE